MDFNWSASVSGLIGAVIGGAISIATTFGSEVWKTRRQSNTLAIALRAEIDAVLALVESRGFMTMLDAAIDAKRRGESQWLAVRVGENYFPIFAGNTSSIGILGPEVALSVIKFYTLAKSFTEDCNGAYERWQNAEKNGTTTALDMREVEFVGAKRILLALTETGAVASTKIAQLYLEPKKSGCPRLFRRGST
jgi:hypothetical protein